MTRFLHGANGFIGLLKAEQYADWVRQPSFPQGINADRVSYPHPEVIAAERERERVLSRGMIMRRVGVI